MNIHEILQYGPICASDEELDWLVTINGAYGNLWVGDGNGDYTNTTCVSGHENLYKLTSADMLEQAEYYLDRWKKELMEEHGIEE